MYFRYSWVDVRAIIYAELYITFSNLILATKIESFMNFQQYDLLFANDSKKLLLLEQIQHC